MNRDSLARELELHIDKIQPITSKVCILYSDNQKFILKEENDLDLLREKYLNSHQLSKYKSYKTIRSNQILFGLYPYYISCGSDASNLRFDLKELHQKTTKKQICGPRHLIRLNRIMESMKRKSMGFELFIREIEMKAYKDDGDWIYLSNYYILLIGFKEIMKCASKIKKLIKDKCEYEECFLQGCPNLAHYIGGKFISFSKFTFGSPINDYYKYYLDQDSSENNLKNEIDDFLAPLETPFKKPYFKLMVLVSYIYFLNLNESEDLNTQELYIKVTKKIAKFLTLFKDY